MALQLVITNAGRTALVNAANTGTLPVLVASVGVTAAAFTASATDVVLPGEIKRLSTFAGQTVANDTIHVTIRDESADVYSMRGFALYLADGTLFALYGQAGVILEKSSQAMLLLSADVIFSAITASSFSFGATNWTNPNATTEVAGIVELATNAEGATGQDPVRAVTPGVLKYVLDQRFGTGAPSTFIKGLLNLATAALLRAALEIKGAALKDEGAGNGLDADKLDGQHGAYYLDWANLANKPATFPPAPHSTAWADITGAPAMATRWPTWSEVSDKPAAYTPAPHSHAAGDIVSGTFADARIAQSSVTQHQGALSITWTQVTGKPATFTPSAHGHGIGEISGLQGALDSKAPTVNPTFSGTVSANAFARWSSERYKHTFRDIDGREALRLLAGVQFKSYFYRADDSFALGVKAEDLAGGDFDFAVKRDEQGRPDSVDYEPLFVTACAALLFVAEHVGLTRSAE